MSAHQLYTRVPWAVALYDQAVRMVDYQGLTFRVGGSGTDVWLQVRVDRPDTTMPHGGGYREWGGRKWRLSPHMTRSEVVQTCLMAVLAFEEHEARERFLYRGRPVFGPHIDVEVLASVCGNQDTREDSPGGRDGGAP